MTKTDKKGKTPSLAVRLLLILLVSLSDNAWVAGLICRWQSAGTMVSVRAASSAFGTALRQQLILASVTILVHAVLDFGNVFTY